MFIISLLKTLLHYYHFFVFDVLLNISWIPAWNFHDTNVSFDKSDSLSWKLYNLIQRNNFVTSSLKCSQLTKSIDTSLDILRMFVFIAHTSLGSFFTVVMLYIISLVLVGFPYYVYHSLSLMESQSCIALLLMQVLVTSMWNNRCCTFQCFLIQ